MSAASPWALSFPLNLVAGFDETKCIKCSTVAGFEMSLDKIRIKVFHQLSIDQCKWLKVRHLPNGQRNWSNARDRLQGTFVINSPADDSLEWSIAFDSIPFNQFMFANEYFTKWLVAEKEEIIPTFTEYNNVPRTWLRSALNPTAPALSPGNQYFRHSGYTEDPMISMGGYNLANTEERCMLYYNR